MPTNIEDFFDIVPSQNGRIKLVDGVLNSNGDFITLYDVDALIKSIERLLLVVKGSYPLDADFGLSINHILFEPNDERNIEDIEKTISEAIQKYEPRANVSVSVEMFDNRKGFAVNFTVDLLGKSKSSSILITEGRATKNYTA